MLRTNRMTAAVAWGAGLALAPALHAAAPAGAATNAEADPLTIPCDGLAPSAVRSVPPPLDRYVTLVCTRSGQALKPVNGSAWVFDQGPMWLSAANARGPSKDDHYTELSYKPLSRAELTALRAELAKLGPEPSILRRDILRFAVSTSWGAHKEIYLLPPPEGAGADARTLGMECTDACRPIDKDPWFFTIVPAK